MVGSGPGGATVARQLAREGRDVVVLERGRDWRDSMLYATYPGALLYADRRALLFTRQGLNIIRPLMLGGATSMYAGCSADPRPWWSERLGIDLAEDAARVKRELGVRPLPAELRGDASTRIAEAGDAVGLEWYPQDKFMRPSGTDFDCAAHCLLGCRCGAKWNAAEYVDDAVEAGARVVTGAHVTQLQVSGGATAGVAGLRKGRWFEVEAGTVVLAAGGIGSPVLLRRAGVDGAGRGMTMDTTVMVYGHAPFEGIGQDPPMTWSSADDELGVLYSTLIDPWLMYPIIMTAKGPAYTFTWHRWGRTLGVMIKLKDEVSGEIDPSGAVSKGLTAADGARLARAEEVAERILRQAGCGPDTIFTTPLRGTHPSSTARIGDVLSTDLESEIPGLYVCDASVFPEALGRPTVLTIICLARRLARTILERRQST